MEGRACAHCGRSSPPPRYAANGSYTSTEDDPFSYRSDSGSGVPEPLRIFERPISPPSSPELPQLNGFASLADTQYSDDPTSPGSPLGPPASPTRQAPHLLPFTASGAPGPPLPPPVMRKVPRRPEVDDTWLCGSLFLTIHSAQDLPILHHVRKYDKPSAYVRIHVDGLKGQRTRKQRFSQNPVWTEQFTVHLLGEVHNVVLIVKDDNTASSLLGRLELPVAEFLHTPFILRRFPLTGPNNGQQRSGSITLSAEYTCSTRFPTQTMVPDVTYPQRRACGFRMYGDTHLSEERRRPLVPIAGGWYRDLDLWNDLYAAILEAKKFIYITGWSVWHELRLVRGPNGSPPLGELLIAKARKGVCVRILLWDDATSIDSSVLNAVLKKTKTGLMNTFDEQTMRFFRNSGVKCRKAKCYARGFSNQDAGTSKRISWLNSHLGYGTVFTHHQKTVSMDAPDPEVSIKRRRISFIGGVDLTTGRYDTPDHGLYRTLNTAHQGDFRNKLGDFDPALGPREPWHDVHSLVEGPIAHDVIENFETRWKRQVTGSAMARLYTMQKDPAFHLEDTELNSFGWDVQMFRSITGDSASNVAEMEADIALAYIHQIRRAQKYIYIENQYFFGSSPYWADFSEEGYNVECRHRIPYELAMRIVTKIRQGERFVVYVCIPLYPEGDPSTATMQGVLHWQAETFRMMYRRVAEALQRWGPAGRHPTEYLVLLCPVQREPHPHSIDVQTVRNPRQRALLQSGRQMIYVHSKLIIFDDEYIIIGSANINERSMSGARDTEIAVGAVEVKYSKKETGHALPQGQVSGFRMSLWGEHLGRYDPLFHRPHSRECVRLVHRLTEANWQAFMDDGHCMHLPHGHWIPYPYQVDLDGTVTPRVPKIPDLDANMMGTRPPDLFWLLTT
eukprot:EG_transcript_1770